MKLILVDIHPGMVSAWQKEFAGMADVEIHQGEVFDHPADAVVSPANSFGYLDGGIDLVYVTRFGWDLQARLQEKIRQAHAGELPVGQALIIETMDHALPWLVSAPTMRTPMDVSGRPHAYLAMKAALSAVRDHNLLGVSVIQSILCPGLGTGIGNIPHMEAAWQMARAWREREE